MSIQKMNINSSFFPTLYSCQIKEDEATTTTITKQKIRIEIMQIVHSHK
jgi:hypothetical protein